MAQCILKFREGKTIRYDTLEYWAGLIKMSLSRFFILHVLQQGPLHGYEISRRVAAITNGCCAPTEGSLYPLLKEFTEAGLVTVEKQIVSGRERKVYTITEQGKAAYRVASSAWVEVAGYILKAVQETNGSQHRSFINENIAPDAASR